jgi:hypothetical protein
MPAMPPLAPVTDLYLNICGAAPVGTDCPGKTFILLAEGSTMVQNVGFNLLFLASVCSLRLDDYSVSD